MLLKSIDEVKRASYAQSRKLGASHEEAIARARHEGGNMGYLYGSLMVIPAKTILMVMFAILIWTSWLDDFSAMHRYAITFGAVWAWWFVAAVFVVKMRHWSGWALYTLLHVILGLIVVLATLG